MSKWEKVRLGDIGTIITGTTPSTSNLEFYNSKDIAFYKPNDLTEVGISNLYTATVYLSELAKPKIRLLPKGSVLVTCIGIIGKVGIAMGECTCNQQINAIIPNPIKVDSRYLAYCILSKKNMLRSIANAPIVPIINKTQFSNVEIPLPPLALQVEIAKKLDHTLDLLALRKQQLAELDHLIKSVFRKMFNSYFYDSSCFEVLPDVCNFIDYRGKTPEKADSGIPLITAKNVKNNAFSLEPREYISNEVYNEFMKRGFPKINDVIFTTEAPLGNVCRIPKIFEKFAVAQRIIVMQPFEDKIISEYLEFVLSSGEIQSEIYKHSSGSTVRGIRSKELEKISIPVPPLELQNQFADVVAKIEEQKALVKKAIDETQTLFDSLMSQYFD